MTERIVTLTLNPAIDLASTAPAVRPLHKIRTTGEHVDPGGGGINVARVVHALGGESLAVLAAGGATGRFLTELLDEAGVPYRAVPIAGRTRVSITVRAADTGLGYRFVPEGPVLSEPEWRVSLAALDEAEGGFVVASGSLPQGVPAEAYAIAARAAAARGRHFVLDSSGEALRAALGAGIALMKPSLGELESLVGRTLPDADSQAAEALALVRAGAARMIAVSLGAAGAILATPAGVLRRPALTAAVHSAVGAGDAFLAAMVLALARGAAPAEALDWGIAAGAVAVAGEGTARVQRHEVTARWREQTGRAPCRNDPA
ncbi:MAG: 1-phosphofructokinase family hexose kinase [Rhodospirillales bacterium]|nr:1-phosphofructokinase family hexose kinase [Rhodospirillales bacterium]